MDVGDAIFRDIRAFVGALQEQRRDNATPMEGNSGPTEWDIAAGILCFPIDNAGTFILTLSTGYGTMGYGY